MDLQKIKTFLLNTLRRILRFGYRVYKKLSGFFEKLFERLPLPAKFRRMAAMISLSLLLVVVVVAAVPVFKTVTGATGSVIDAIMERIDLPDSGDEEVTESEAYVDRNASAPVLKDVLPEAMEVPKNDILQIPTGGTAFRFTEAELLKLQRLMVFTEKCESFDYNDTDKDVGMALTAYRLLVETNDTNLTLNPEPYYYTVRHLHLQKYIHQLFGRNLSSTENLGQIYYTDDRYLYFAKTGEPTAVSGYITEAYSLGDNYYKISGIVTRGFANEEGRYSRRISLVLLKHSEAMYGYYIVSVVNEPMTYTYLDSLLKTLPPDENALLHVGQQSSANTAGTASQGMTVSGDPTASNESGASEMTSSGDASSTAPVESVTQPEIDKQDKETISKEEETALQNLLQTIPVPLTDFDASSYSSESLRMLTAHLLLCKEKSLDPTTQITSNTYGEILAKSEQIFGSTYSSIMPNQREELYTIDPYITTGKTEFSKLTVYALGNDHYIVTSNVSYYANPLLDTAEKYTYTAVVQKSADAQFGFWLKSQTFEKK